MTTSYLKDISRKQNIKKVKEEFSMNQFAGSFPQPPIPGAGAPPTPPVAGATPVAGGSGVTKVRADVVKAAVQKGLAIRPLGLVVDGNEIHRYEYDAANTELETFINNWQMQNKKQDKVSGKMVPKSITPIRAVKELCIKQNRNPREFAKFDEAGAPMLQLKKPSIKGFIIKFPSTEGTGSYVDIVKKSALSEAINRAGGFQLAGTYIESSLDAEALDIPVALLLTATNRKVTDKGGRTEQKSILRISGQMTKDLLKKLFPNKNNVSIYDMFKSIPFDQYKYTRVVPLKLYKTELVEGKEVGVLDLDPEKKLAQYESYENPLEQEEFGAGLMNAIGKSAAELQATFARKSNTAANETEADLVSLVVKSYVGPNSDPVIVDRYVNNLMMGQF